MNLSSPRSLIALVACFFAAVCLLVGFLSPDFRPAPFYYRPAVAPDRVIPIIDGHPTTLEFSLPRTDLDAIAIEVRLGPTPLEIALYALDGDEPLAELITRTVGRARIRFDLSRVDLPSRVRLRFSSTAENRKQAPKLIRAKETPQVDYQALSLEGTATFRCCSSNSPGRLASGQSSGPAPYRCSVSRCGKSAT